MALRATILVCLSSLLFWPFSSALAQKNAPAIGAVSVSPVYCDQNTPAILSIQLASFSYPCTYAGWVLDENGYWVQSSSCMGGELFDIFVNGSLLGTNVQLQPVYDCDQNGDCSWGTTCKRWISFIDPNEPWVTNGYYLSYSCAGLSLNIPFGTVVSNVRVVSKLNGQSSSLFSLSPAVTAGRVTMTAGSIKGRVALTGYVAWQAITDFDVPLANSGVFSLRDFQAPTHNLNGVQLVVAQYPSGNIHTPYSSQWQQSVNGGAWQNIAGTANVSSYSVPTNVAPNSQFRLRVGTLFCGEAFTNAIAVPPMPTQLITSPAQNNSLCSGQPPAPLTGTVTGGSGDFEYQWQYRYPGMSGWATDQLPSTANLALPYPLHGGGTFYYRRIVLDRRFGWVNYSNEVAITLQPGYTSRNGGEVAVPHPNGSRAFVWNACPGTTMAIQNYQTAAEGGNYQWQWSPDGVRWPLVAGATSPGLSIAANTFSGTRFYRRRATTVSGCDSVFSNIVTISLQPLVAGTATYVINNLSNIIGVPPRPNTVCAGTGGYVTGGGFVQITTLPVGGSGTHQAHLQHSPDQVAWATVSSMGLAWNNTFNSGLPAQTQAMFYRVMFTDANNAGCAPVYSPVTRIEVAPPPTPGTIQANGSTALCAGGQPPLLQSQVAATNFDVYYWGFTTAANPNDPNASWTSVPNANGASYQVPTTLSQTTHYRRAATSVTCGQFTSNIITITVAAAPQGGVVGNSVATCPNEIPPAIQNLAPATGGSGTITYQWQQRQPNGVWVNMSATTEGLTFSAPLTTTTFFRREADFGACGKQYSNEVKISVFAATDCGSVASSIPAFESAQRLNLFATLKQELDESFHITDANGFAYFNYVEAHAQPATSKLDCRLYTWQRKEVGRILLAKSQGNNWYGLDLSGVCQPEQYYVMEVYDDNVRLTTLRIRFVKSNTPEQVALTGPSDFCPGEVLTHRVAIQGGTLPYRVTWTLNNQPQPSLTDQVQAEESVHSFQVNPTLASLASFPIRAVVTDVNNRQIGQPQERVLVKRDCTQPRANPVPDPPRIQVVFSIRQLILPRKL
jgi:hypothetical protein